MLLCPPPADTWWNDDEFDDNGDNDRNDNDHDDDEKNDEDDSGDRLSVGRALLLLVASLLLYRLANLAIGGLDNWDTEDQVQNQDHVEDR